MAESDVSIVMPVYNHAVLLKRALSALIAQTRAPREIIVIDDASNDDSAQVAEDMRPLLERRSALRVLRNDVNMGVNPTFNRGLEEARGAWVCCTAADDWLEPRFIAAMTDASQMFPRARLITSQYAEFFEADERHLVHERSSDLGIWFSGSQPAFFDADATAALLQKGFIQIPVSASLVDTRTLQALGGFDQSLKWHSDWFAATAISLRHGFAVVPEPLAVFRRAEGTYSGDNVQHKQRQREVCTAIAEKLDQPQFSDVGAALAKTPAPFAPFVRHMLPALAQRAESRYLFRRTARWWLGEVAKGRRPGRLRAVVRSLGVRTTPRIDAR